MIITGASSGIGEATARLAARNGAHVVLAARRRERIEELAHELGGVAVATDLRDPAQIVRLAAVAQERYGRIDVLVNNAAQGLDSAVAALALEDLVAVMELNVYAPVLALHAVLPAMRRQGAGAIVNVSSDITHMTVPGTAGYAASKAALNMISAVARAELAAAGITVSLVLPTLTATPFAASARGRGGDVAPGAWPVEPQSPERVAEAILRAVAGGQAEIHLGH
jgi:short-subunit dehydrogenase